MSTAEWERGDGLQTGKQIFWDNHGCENLKPYIEGINLISFSNLISFEIHPTK
jgi:hypothetical protein